MKNLITGFLFCLLSGVVFADTWTVDDDGAADFDNIQAAVNAASDGDEIIIMAGSYTSTGAQVVDTLGKAITLRGQSVDSTIIDGENVRRGITCRSTSQSNVVIENLWITDCISDYGGGLWIEGNPEVKTCWIMNNDATSSGGNVYVLSGNPIFSAGCNFNYGSAPFGAGVYCKDGSPEFDSCYFLSNNASERGGGIRGRQISGYFTNCIFSNNTASRGGAGHFQESLNGLSSTFDTCYFQNNTASSLGGGVANNSTANSLFQSCSFVNNTSTGLNGGQGSGGGMFNDSSNPHLLSCIFDSNTANSNGGGVYNWSSSPQVQDCQFLNNSAATGGGIKSYNGTGPSITSSTFCENMPDNVSGVHVDDGTNCLAYSCADYDSNGTPDECESTVWTVDDDGLDYPSADFDNIQSAINAASNGEQILVFPGTYTSGGTYVVDLKGKDIWLHSTEGANVTVIDGENDHRVVLCDSGETSSTLIEGFTIANGNSPEGGGVRCSYSSPSFKSCIIENNSAVSNDGTFSFGGGVFCYESNSLFTDCIIQDNHIDNGFYKGGLGIYCIYSELTFVDCIIQNNLVTSGANNFGGGIRASYSNVVISGCQINGNTASLGAGVGIFASQVSLVDTSFNDNIAHYNGGGLHCDAASSASISGCSFSGNFALGSGSPYPNGHNIFAIDQAAITFANANDIGDIVSIDFNLLSFSANSNAVAQLYLSDTDTLVFDLDESNSTSFLSHFGTLFQYGSLALNNSTQTLLESYVGDTFPLVTAGGFSDNFESVIFPVMPQGLGLQLIQYPTLRGGDTEIAVEVIEVEGAQFANPFSGELDSAPIDIKSFDADGDGTDEIAVLFGGIPGGVAVYAVSDDAAPSLIAGFSAEVGSNPVDLDAGDINGDGFEDLLVANSSSNTITVLVTTLGADGTLIFIDSTINTSYTPTCVAIIDWDGDADLDAVVGQMNPGGYQVLLDVAASSSSGPSFSIPPFQLSDDSYVSDRPTCVDGGDQTSLWGFVGGTRYGRVHHATSGSSLQLIAELGGNNIMTIEAIELDSGSGDGQIDLMISSDEADTIYLLQGDAAESDGFDDLIPVSVFAPVEDVLAIDADDDGDMDIVMTAPTSDTPLVLLRNDGGGTELVGGLNGITWSKQEMNSGNPLSSIEPVDVNDTKDLDNKVIVGAGGATNLRGELAGTMEQTNILLGSDCDADLDGNGSVDIDDLLSFISEWGPCNGACPADFDGNGEVAIDDLLVLISAWGPCN